MIRTAWTADRITLVEAQLSTLTAATALGFKDRVLELIEAGHNLLVIDLAAVRIVDASGIGALVSLLKRIGVRGEVALCGLSESVMQMFRITRMDRVFAIHSDSSHAVEALGG